MDLNHRSPGYEPDGISRLPHLAESTPKVHGFQPTACTFMLKTAPSEGESMKKEGHLP